MFKYAILALTALLAVGNSDVVKQYQDCGSTGKIIEVRIVPCPASPCVLKKNTNIGLEIDFQTREDCKALDITMYGILGGIIPPLPWHGVAKNACDNTIDAAGKPACPIQDGDQVLHYKNSFKVASKYPAIPLTVKVTITDPSQKILVCFSFPVKIES